MPLVNAKDMEAKALKGHYAVGAFNINNLEWTKAILQTAEGKRHLFLHWHFLTP
jgi:fructose-bisphosphate aldolase class II